jgi:hypothetical protein
MFDRGVVVQIWPDEIRVLCVRLSPGEDIAFLINRETNQAHLNCPLDVAQSLAAQHQYELVLPKKPEPSAARIARFLSMISPTRFD